MWERYMNRVRSQIHQAQSAGWEAERMVISAEAAEGLKAIEQQLGEIRDRLNQLIKAEAEYRKKIGRA